MSPAHHTHYYVALFGGKMSLRNAALRKCHLSEQLRKCHQGSHRVAHVLNEHCSARFRLSTISRWEMKMFGFKKWKLSFLRIYWPSIALVAANIYLLCAYLLYENKLEFTRHFCCCGSSAQRWELSKKFSSLLLNLFVQRHSRRYFPSSAFLTHASRKIPWDTLGL